MPEIESDHKINQANLKILTITTLICLPLIFKFLVLYDSGGFGRVVNGLKRGDTLPILAYSVHN